MSLVKYQNWAVDEAGNIVALSAYEVRDTAGALMSIYSDSIGTASSNPGAATSSGLIEFYAEKGVYDITVGGGSSATTQRVVIGGPDVAYFSSRADAVAAVAAGSAEIYGRNLMFDGSIWYKYVSGSTKFSDLPGWEISGGALSSSITVQIPTDHATIQAAIEAWQNVLPNGYRIYINIESGHVINGGFAVHDGNFGHFEITSDDAVVYAVATNIKSSTRNPTFFSSSGSFAWAMDAVAPVWSILVDCQNTGPEDAKGFTIVGAASSFSITSYCGLMNLGNRATLGGAEPSQYGYGLLAWNCATVRANYAIISGSAGRNLWISRSARFSGAYGDFSGAQGLYGVGVDPQDNANHGGIYCTRASWANVEYANLSGCANRAITVTRGYVNAEGADCSGAGGASLAAGRGGSINAYGTKTNSSVETAFPYTPSSNDLATTTEFNHIFGSGFIMSAQVPSWPHIVQFSSNSVYYVLTQYATGEMEVRTKSGAGTTATYHTANELRAPALVLPAGYQFVDTDYARILVASSPSSTGLRGNISTTTFSATASGFVPVVQSNSLFVASDTCNIHVLAKGRWK